MRSARIIVDGRSVEFDLDDLTLAEVGAAFARSDARRQRDPDRAVRRYLGEHPDASKNEVARRIPRRRADVLAAVDRVRAMPESSSRVSSPARPVPVAGNHLPDGVAS